MKIKITYLPEEERQAQNWALITANSFCGAKLKESKAKPESKYSVIYINIPSIKPSPKETK